MRTYLDRPDKENDHVICEVIRNKYTDDTTIGRWFFPDKEDYCYTLEDTVRAEGIKVNGNTALAAGYYKMSTRYSPMLKRDVAVIYTEDDKITAKNGGISFKYALAHAGATHKNTAGCILVSDEYDNDERIAPTRDQEQEIKDRIKKWESEGKEVWLHIINKPQAG